MCLPRMANLGQSKYHKPTRWRGDARNSLYRRLCDSMWQRRRDTRCTMDQHNVEGKWGTPCPKCGQATCACPPLPQPSLHVTGPPPPLQDPISQPEEESEKKSSVTFKETVDHVKYNNQNKECDIDNDLEDINDLKEEYMKKWRNHCYKQSHKCNGSWPKHKYNWHKHRRHKWYNCNSTQEWRNDENHDRKF